MSREELNLSEWLATPEGPPESVWRAVLRMVEPAESHTEGMAHEAATDLDPDQIHDDARVDDPAPEDLDALPAHPPPLTPHEGAASPSGQEDLDADYYA